ncbi:MAG: hypothetical protein U0X58_08555 [Flavobacteriaceae bacterium]
MDYSVNNLSTVADCNALLTWAGREKADLSFKKLSDERLTSRIAETSQELDAELQGVLTEISATETIINILPDGPSKDDAINKKTRLEYKKFLLENRRESYGTVALLEKQMDLARVQVEIDEVDAFISAVEQRKAAI